MKHTSGRMMKDVIRPRIIFSWIILCLVRLFYSIQICYAQTEVDDLLQFRHFLQNPSEANELGLVWSITQDGEGALWFAGSTTVARFDGLEFTFFNEGKTDNSSFRARLLSDRRGIVWLMNEKGVQVLRTESQNFQTVISSLGSPKYIDFAVSGAESLWLLSNSDLAKLNIDTYDVIPFKSTTAPNSPLSGKHLIKIFEDSQRRLWVGTENSELFVYSQAGDLLKHWMHNPNNVPTVLNMQFMEDRDRNIWVSAKGAGAIKISSDLIEEKRFFENSAQDALPTNDITGIGQDLDGSIWMALDHFGLTVFDPNLHQFRPIHHSRYDSMTPATDQPQGIYFDNVGGLWVIQHPRGIDYLGRANLAVERYRKNPADAVSISHNGVDAIFRDSAQRIWVGTESGLNLFDPQTRQFSHFLDGIVITAIVESNDGNIWAGTWADGLYELNIQHKSVKHVGRKEGFVDAGIWSLHSDQSFLWLGTSSRGLVRYSIADGEFFYYTHDNHNLNSISSNKISAIAEYRPDALLVATDFGLNVFHKKLGTFESVGNESGNRDIRCVLTLNNGQIWVGTTGGGISIFDQNLVLMGSLNVNSGLPNETVNGLTQDENGMVWAITLAGVAHINPITREISVLTRGEGLAGNYYNRNAVMADDHGSVYLGSADGLSIIKNQPSSWHIPETPANINKLLILNREVEAATPNSPLSKSILFTEQLTLNYRDSLIGIGFSTINLTGGNDVRFRYQLVGVDKTWITANNERRANYSNLLPGNYTFRVQAGDAKEFWPGSEDTLRLIVLPPPWITFWAKIIYLLVAIGILLLVSLLVTLRHKRRHAEMVLNIKNDFLSVLSHEIRTPLAGVIGMLQLLLKDQNVSLKTREQIQLGYMNAQTLQNITNDILNINAIERQQIAIESVNFNLRLTIETLTATYLEMALNKGVSLIINIGADVPEFIVADPLRISQVLTNLLSNALKFTDRGSISLLVRADPAQIEFVVTDTGIGLPEDALTRLFEKYEQGDTATNRIYGGTGLGLSICSLLVTAMGGAISASRSEQGGSRFQFTIPLILGAMPSAVHREFVATSHQYRLNILCAEDFETNQLIIRQFIEEMGHKITIVDNGVSALESLRQQRFDLILMDRRMPIMDGNQACKHIRAGIWGDLILAQKDIPIIALTANITESDKESYIQVGMNAIVGKPIDQAELAKAIDVAMQQYLAAGNNLVFAESAELIPVAPLEINAMGENELDALFGVSPNPNNVGPTESL